MRAALGTGKSLSFEGKGNGGWLGLANQYLILYGPMAWDMIRADRTKLEAATGRLADDYRQAEHFLWAFQNLNPERGWLQTALLTEGYWVVKAVSNLLLQDSSPWIGSPVNWEQLIAGLYGNYCATFGCAGVE